MTDLSDQKNLVYKAKHKIRFVTTHMDSSSMSHHLYRQTPRH